MSDQTGSRAGLEVRPSVSEFPDWLNPVFVRDLRQGLRGRSFIWGFIILQSLALIATLIEWAIAELLGGTGALLSGGFGIAISFTFSFLMPFSLFSALQPELGRGRNLELLLTSRLSRWQIVRGKWLVASTLSALILISLFPYFLIRYFLGGIELTGLIVAGLGLMFSNAVMNAIIIGASAFRDYVGRFFIILLLMLVYGILSSSYSLRSAITGGVSGNAFFDFAGQVLIPTLCMILSLQLGRSKLKLFDNPLDPPAPFLILVFLFLAPIFHGIALGTGGPVASVAVLAIMIAGALIFDPGSPLKKQLKAGPA